MLIEWEMGEQPINSLKNEKKDEKSKKQILKIESSTINHVKKIDRKWKMDLLQRSCIM